MSRLILSTINQYGQQSGIIDWFEKSVSILTNTKTKRVTLGLAVALTALGYAIHKITSPPKQLKHLPYVSVWSLIYHFVIKQHNCPDMHEAIGKPYIAKCNGLYLLLDRLGWVIQVADPIAARTVLFKGDIFPKAEISAPPNTYLDHYCGNDNMLFTNGSKWLKHRKLANPAFKTSLPVGLFSESVTTLINLWEKEYPSDTFKVDIYETVEKLTLDTIGKAAFGFEFNALEDENSEWKRCYDVINEAASDPLFAIFPACDQRFRFLFPKREYQFKILHKFKNLLSKAIQEKRELIQQMKHDNTIDDAEKDLLTLMLESEYKGEGALTNEEILANIAIIFVAGHDTTAFSLSSAIYYLAKYPEIQERARQEVNSILCSNGEVNEYISPTADDIKKLDYVTQIIKETLRIRPSVNFLVSPRRVLEDVDLNGTFVPKGSLVNINIYNLHHNPAVWDNPEEFNPDRFAPGGEAEQKSGIAWTPFSSGNRMCIGMNFSMAQQRTILAGLLRKYEWSLPEDSIHKDTLKNRFSLISINQDLNIHFKKRY